MPKKPRKVSVRRRFNGRVHHIYSIHHFKGAARDKAKKELAPRGFRYRIVKATYPWLRGDWIVFVESGGAKSRRLPEAEALMPHREFKGARRFGGRLYQLVGPARHRTVKAARKEAARLRRGGFPARVVKRKGVGASVYASMRGKAPRRGSFITVDGKRIPLRRR